MNQLPPEAYKALADQMEKGATGEFRIQLNQGQVVGFVVLAATRIKRTERACLQT